MLGRGKTGAQVIEIAKERGHNVRVLGAADNAGGKAITRETMQGVDALLDFTTPTAVIPNITAACAAGVNMVVGTTGWQQKLASIQPMVEESGIGFVWGTNFSVGVNLFFDIARAAAAAEKHGYAVRVVERHHIHKKDAPSGTAVTIQNLLTNPGQEPPPIESIREGETIGTHVILMDGADDTMMLVHDAKSRRGFAEGAVRAAEWLAGKRGIYEFKDIFSNLP